MEPNLLLPVWDDCGLIFSQFNYFHCKEVNKPGLISPVFKRRTRNASKSLGLCHGDEVYVEMTNQWVNAERKLEKQKFYFIGTFPCKLYHILISRGTSLRRKSKLNKFIFHYSKCVFKKWLGHLGSFITRRFTSRV